LSIPGPIDGHRLSIMDTPVKIYDLSEDGCFVHVLYEAVPGTRLKLRIELPDDRPIEVNAEALHNTPHFGFAAGFREMSDTDRAALTGAVNRLGQSAARMVG
jgi:hypothetical protein